MSRIPSLLSASLSAVLSLSAGAADLERGQRLHDDNCKLCHDSTVYTREDHRMSSLDELRDQVEMCQGDVGAEWSEAEIGDVVAWLNHTYYHFEGGETQP